MGVRWPVPRGPAVSGRGPRVFAPAVAVPVNSNVLTAKWDVAAEVAGAARTVKWDLGAEATQTARTVKWDLASQATGTARTLLWDVVAQATGTARTVLWDTSAQTTGTARSLKWDVAAEVAGGTRTVKWDVATPVDGTARTTKWDVAAEVNGVARSLKWDVVAEIAATARTLKWDVAVAVNGTARTLLWDLVAGPTQVTSSAQRLVWDVVAQVNSAARTLKWDVVGQVTGTVRSLRWNTAAQADGVARTVLWDTRNAIDGAARTLKWDVASQASSVAKLLKWDVVARVDGNLRTLLWDLAGTTTTTVARLSLAAGGTPATRTAHSIEVRARKVSGSGTVILRAALYEGATNRSGDLASTALGTALATYSLAVPDAGAAAISSYSDLELRLWATSATGDVVNVEVADLRLQTPPAVVVPTPVNSAPRTLKWDLASADLVDSAELVAVWDMRTAVDGAARSLKWDLLAGGYAAVVLADAASAYWRLEETTNASPVLDTMGGTPGVFVGSPTVQQAGALIEGDKAVLFNGTSQYITVADTAALETGDTFTWEAWVRPSSLAALQTLMWRPGEGKLTIGVDGAVGFEDDSFGTQLAHTQANVIDTARFHHVVVTKNGATTRIYVDGHDETIVGTNVTMASVHALWIGARDFFGVGEYVSGTIDDVAVYDSALTAGQVLNHYYVGSGRSAIDGASRTVKWDVRNAVNAAARSLVWDTRSEVVGTVRSLRWDVVSQTMGSARTFKWDVAGRIDGVARTLVWDVAALTSGPVNGNPVALVWDVGGPVNGLARTLKWDLGTTVSGTARTLKWDVAGAASSAPRVLAWDVRATVSSATRTLKWNLDVGVLLACDVWTADERVTLVVVTDEAVAPVASDDRDVVAVGVGDG